MGALDAAYEKVSWAIDHLQEFEVAKREFVDSRAYRVVTKQAREPDLEWIDIPAEGFRRSRMDSSQERFSSSAGIAFESPQ